MRYVLLIGMLLGVPTWASNPGGPMDCTDWIIVEPGLSCSELAPLGSLDDQAPWIQDGPNLVVDHLGRQIVVRFTLPEGHPFTVALGKVEIVRFDGLTEDVLAYVDDRQYPTPGSDGRDHFRPLRQPQVTCTEPVGCRAPVAFDRLGGRLLIPANTFCTGLTNVACQVPHYDLWGLIAIDGFGPLLDIFQSYEPTTSSLTFTTPALPEGLGGADYFDTYTGDLATVGDWSQVQPLQCGYPANAPTVGDPFSVADTLPDPAPGTGRYYVTAVTYQGQIRYGRKAVNGVLSGRDPGVLPPCN